MKTNPKVILKQDSKQNLSEVKKPSIINENDNIYSLVFAHFWPLYIQYNYDRFQLLDTKKKEAIRKRIFNTLTLFNKDFPNIFLKKNFISTLPLPFIKYYTDSKRKANEYFRQRFKNLFPDYILNLIGVAELYKCFHQCHYPQRDVANLTVKDHNRNLCSEKNLCSNIHWECEQGWHFPFWHIVSLNFNSWNYGKVYTKQIAADDIYQELSYFLKNYIEIKLNPKLFKQKKLDPRKPYYHRFNEEEDLIKREKKSFVNRTDYIVRKEQSFPLRNLLITIENTDGKKLELKRSSLIVQRKRLKDTLQKTEWNNQTKRETLTLKLKALNLIISTKNDYWKLTKDNEWIWANLQTQKSRKN